MDISDAFGVPGEKDNERRVIDLCAERGYVWVTHTLSTRVCINIPGWLKAKMEER